MTNIITSLHDSLSNPFVEKQIGQVVIPAHITDNLNPKFNIRPYQAKAFKRFLFYLLEDFEGKPRQNHQLLFHMATGSGKTLMMAGAILHLYAQGYRNFLFFVHSTNIIDKTRDNFLNPLSNKHLFSNSVHIDNQQVFIKEVSNFSAANPDDINIVFSTIQGLHTDLNKPKENSLTYVDFEQSKIVLISDEAHHINADTKKSKKQEDLFEVQSWEGTVEKIFKSHEDNVLLEFTATMDLSDANLAAKYKPKLIFDYPLREFRRDSYSKEVKVLQANLTAIERALLAVVLSQYRLKVFAKHQKIVKPVVLFKSKYIKDSQAFQDEFALAIQNLTAAKLSEILNHASDPAISKALTFFNDNHISLENLVIELKQDFAAEKLISVNSKEESEAKQIAVNTLEDAGNQYRAVFAVDKLNEGWDVLNLFDIVRLYNTRDSKNNRVGNTTMSEAQLIGRGARYCPFQITSDQTPDMRKYDADLDNELRVCEELYYHSEYNPKYIQELNVALVQIGMKATSSFEKSLKLKESFKNTHLYQHGYVFLNEQEKNLRESALGLNPAIVDSVYKIKLRTGDTSTTQIFNEKIVSTGEDVKSKDFKLVDFGESIIRKAMQKLPFYTFSNLKNHLPNLVSSNEFINAENYLGNLKLEITGKAEQLNNLSVDARISATLQVLKSIATAIASSEIEYKGTKTFRPKALKSVFTDKKMSFSTEIGDDQQTGRSMCSAIESGTYYLDLTTKDWYVFDDCFGSSEEKLLIKYIEKRYDELIQKYSEVYLIRNEKHFKLYHFDDERALEPDFLLYLIGKDEIDTMHYQVFIEPKGGHLLKTDEWKEQFLTRIKGEFNLNAMLSNRQYVMWGLPFYNSTERAKPFNESFEQLLQ
ncbi:DEAD/DEAH box helicase family protein [Methylotenera sp.]|uniref:DEAD/DEAH box helicase family protein n=1 Tax=Methylotenera sp. TaxID=2051956 RepID=UPI00271C4C7D|nr:DEAD/DEAH box helicase family protein [Methylotenera sp.]MDO9204137.1 DEAD/DEAH box helicase family protein [Methylotenera sp.]MDP2071739.1 DEAD/DEAH box helicase family protein [Methylotenera sp.]MDP3006056.1 DEAD/DEAH box helicase family protein [Methylotenera sp.]